MLKTIEALNRLFAVLNCRTDILQHLKDEKLITDDVMQTLLNEHHTTHAPKIASLLSEMQKSEKLQLVDYEWTILPKEYLKLTIVSRNSKKEWIYTV